jgi:hypothetical protein
VLDNLLADDGKQRTIILGDLAAVEAAAGQPEEACRWANEALDQLSVTLVRRRHGPDPRRP